MTEGRRQMTEDGGQKTEDRRRRTEDGRQETDDRWQMVEDGRQMTEAIEWGMGKAEIKGMAHRVKSRGYGAKGFDFGIRNRGCGLRPIGA